MFFWFIFNCFANAYDIIHFFVRNYECRRTRPNTFLGIAASAANAAAVNPRGIKTILVNGTFFITAKIVFSNGPKSLLKTPLDCPILCN